MSEGFYNEFEGLKKIHKYHYLIGTEIETTIDKYPCEYVPENCPHCESCIENKFMCDYCDFEEIKEYIINEYNLNENETDDNTICEICLKNEIYRLFICQYCEPCENCNGVMPMFLKEVEDYIEDCYNDESCGLEVVTKPFNSIAKYYEALIKITEKLGTDVLNVEYYCGGHINISWKREVQTPYGKTFERSQFYEKNIVKNLVYFADLLTYMFCTRETHYRYEYKQLTHKYSHIYIASLDKYHAIHVKPYAIEIRYPDTPNSPFDHLLLSVANLCISFITHKIKDYENEYKLIYSIYSKINEYGKDLTEKQKKYLKKKFNFLIRTIRPYLKTFSLELGIDLEKALRYRINNPRYEIETEDEITDKPFRIRKTKEIEEGYRHNQTTLDDF